MGPRTEYNTHAPQRDTRVVLRGAYPGVKALTGRVPDQEEPLGNPEVKGQVGNLIDPKFGGGIA